MIIIRLLGQEIVSFRSSVVGEVIDDRMGDHMLDKNSGVLFFDVEDSSGGSGHVVLSRDTCIKIHRENIVLKIMLNFYFINNKFYDLPNV